jgi:hypothetical protein
MTFLSTTSTPGLDRLIRTTATPLGCPPLGVHSGTLAQATAFSVAARQGRPPHSRPPVFRCRSEREDLRPMKKALAAVVLCALPAVAVGGGPTGAVATGARGPFVTGGCPRKGDYGGGTAQEAAAAAITYYIREHPLIRVQGRTYHRTAANTPPVEIVLLPPADQPPLPGATVLKRQALRRCSGRATSHAAVWAVVFHESVSVLCCVHTTFFVSQRAPHHWFAF